MATMEQALTARLLGASTVTIIAGNRTYWGEVPQGVQRPHVTLNIISDPRPEHLKGYQATRSTRVQADCRADDAATAMALARAIIGAVEPAGMFHGHRFGRTKAEGPRALNEDVDGILVHRQSVDLIIWHVGD